MPQLGSKRPPPSLRLNLDLKSHLQQHQTILLSNNTTSTDDSSPIPADFSEESRAGNSRKRARIQLHFGSKAEILPSSASGCLSPTDSPALIADSLKLAAELQKKHDADPDGKIGSFCLLSPLDSNGFSYHALDTRNQAIKTCQILTPAQYEHFVKVWARLEQSRLEKRWPLEDGDPLSDRILPKEAEIIRQDNKIYLFSPKDFGSFHGYVQTRKKLDETDARKFYRQIVRLVAFCHCSGIVLRDLKLRKFVFTDDTQRELRLSSVRDLLVCENFTSDNVSDRQGCPAYVSPEILNLEQKSYSGKSADIWSLGVLLFVILLGRYPFYANSPAVLFGKIRRGQFAIPAEAKLTEEAKCLLRGLLRREPKERPSALTLLKIPWVLESRGNLVADAIFSQTNTGRRVERKKLGKFVENDDQVVPCICQEDFSDQKTKVDQDEVPSAP